MQPVDDVGIAIADTYAKALFELGSKAGLRDELAEELSSLVAYVNGHRDLETFVTSAAIDPGARRASIEKIFRGRANDLLVDFLQVLNKKERLPLLEQVSRQYRLAVEAVLQQVEVAVTTAAALTEPLREALVAALRTYTGRSPILTERVDSALVGGMVVYVGDEKIDFSIRRRLAGLHEVLLKRASHELHGGRSYIVGAA